MKTLTGRTAVVTGGASGIGYALAQRFVAEGMSVVIADIEAAPLQAAAVSLRADGGKVLDVVTDVRDLAAVEALAQATVDEFGGVHVLCNNAGVETGGSFSQIPASAWEWVIAVNLYGVLNGCRTFLPLLEREPEAHIINTSSVAAFASGTATMTPYCVSKSAILALSECLAVELKSTQSSVGISVLAPGPVHTQMPDAERNLPEGVPPAAEPARLAMVRDLKAKAATVGLDPADVADQVVAGIAAEEFFILPHPTMALDGILRRLRWMETGEFPPPRVAAT